MYKANVFFFILFKNMYKLYVSFKLVTTKQFYVHIHSSLYIDELVTGVYSRSWWIHELDNVVFTSFSRAQSVEVLLSWPLIAVVDA